MMNRRTMECQTPYAIRELGHMGQLVCLDGIEISDFDFVDIGRVLEPSKVVPVIIKSLDF